MQSVPVDHRLADQSWAECSVHDVHLAFLRAEWHKISAQADRRLIDQPDLLSQTENQQRAAILYSYRAPLLQRVPQDTRWYKVSYLKEGHLDEVLVIGHCGWDSQQDRNDLLLVAQRKPIQLQTQPHTWTEPILWGHTQQGPFTILEGNNRLVAFAGVRPRLSLQLPVFIGLSPSRCLWHLPDPVPKASV